MTAYFAADFSAAVRSRGLVGVVTLRAGHIRVTISAFLPSRTTRLARAEGTALAEHAARN